MADEERRQIKNEVNRLIYGKVKSVEEIVLDVRREVKVTNGRVSNNEEKIEEHSDKLEAIEKTEVFEDGYRKGKKSMKTSTRNLILMILSIIGVGIAVCTIGIREIRHYKAGEIAGLRFQVHGAESWYKANGSPTTEGLPWNKH